ncbi:unnamed protein product [Oncorhynchus mykiss]|uniref:Uncharacterized protein n=1 Tax=Oncorhynchus mykiss TaxID=8022 RepID=A0A060Z622_ONCMY|nr:unnamed protein product [Oncorhynchus mykiss]
MAKQFYFYQRTFLQKVRSTISKQTAGGRAFSYRAPFLWNGLPIHVRDADSVSTFKSLLKTHLFSWSYD